MIPTLNLLAMGAGLAATPTAALGQQTNILETPSRVDTRRDDLALVNSWREPGVQAIGIPEARYRNVFALTWDVATDGVRTFIRRHYRAYLAGGSAPFEWVRPGDGDVFMVQYQGPPRSSARRRTGGGAAVTLIEVFQTD
jgi:hypothetical protein